MKIGLLTYYGDLNCGTNLQAYACLLALRKMFPMDEVELIPLHGFDPPGVHPYFSHFTILSLYRDLVRIRKYSSFVKNLLNVKKDLVIKDVNRALSYIENRSYDMIFVGSDTILELDRIKDGSPLSLYWLSPQIKAKKILLAASSKNVRYDDLSDIQKTFMQATLDDFVGLGVRDENTADLIASYTQKEHVQLIPDPTFSLDIDDQITTDYLKKRGMSIPQNSLLFHTTKSDNGWAKPAADAYRKKGHKIYSLRPVSWADEILNDMSPLEQLGIYKYFECVVTHRFHDAVFSFKNKTPMLLYTPGGFLSGNDGKSKFTHLLESFDLLESNYMRNPHKDILNKLDAAIDLFKSKKEDIESQLNHNKEQFETYINQFK